MNPIGQYKKRKGVGSIIAGAFIVLIIMSGYALYQFNNQAQSDYQEIITTMSNEDIIRSQEDLDILYYESRVQQLDSPIGFLNTLNITVKVINNGPTSITLKYGAILLEGELITDERLPNGTEMDEVYTKLFDVDTGYEDIFIQPTKTEYITVLRTRMLSSPFDRFLDYALHLVSENGKVLSLRESDIKATTIIDAMSNVADVIGDVLPKYKATEWGTINGKQGNNPGGLLQTPPGWMNKHYIDSSIIDDAYIFRVSVRHYGNTPLTLSNDTVLYFETLGDSAAELPCYIVHYSGARATSYNGHEITLPAYIQTSQQLPGYYTLYFAAYGPGDDPSDGENFANNRLKAGTKYQVKLGIFDYNKNYAQTFSLIAVEVY